MSLLSASTENDYNRNIEGGMKYVNGKSYNVYKVDKDAVVIFWKNSWEAFFTEKIQEYDDRDELIEDLKQRFGVEDD